jgi:two-component system cell cycle sensor histidine kinase/response regulator CckA
MNLVINASEAIGEKDGTIRVATSHVVRRPESPPEDLGDLPPGDYLRLEVSDTGCGMSEEAKARIFDPFFTTKFAGRGLGLAVVHGVLRAHGGAIYLVSAPGQGTTFQILLPCCGQATGQDHCGTTPPAPLGGIPNGTGTVLLVEDEAPLRQAVSTMLRRKGFAVIEAGDGSAAVDHLHTDKDTINLILLDMTIPGVSSREVIAEARRVRPDIKVILTSAYSREMALHSINEQVKGFIRKPFRLAELVQVLRDALSS